MGEYVENKCWECVNKKEVPGNAHIRCAKPDPDMIGNPHGIKNGWFFYPLCFDPVWMEKKCVNFKSNKTAVSQAVSPEKDQT